MALAVLVSACGGGGTPQSVAHLGKLSPTTTAIPTAGSGGFGGNLQQMYPQALSYAGCMRAHGDPSFPDPVLVNTSHSRGITMGANVDQSSRQYRSANAACQHLLPNNGQGPTQAQVQQGMAQLLKAAECMRSHGVPNFPHPTESNGGKAIGFHMSGIDGNSPQFLHAQKACRSLTPLLGGG